MTATLVLVLLLILILLMSNMVRDRRNSARTDALACHARENQIDIEVLSLLLSKEETQYLRRSLSEHEFRSIRRRRVSLARKYLGSINTNVASLISAAEAATSSSDHEVAQAAQELLRMAFRVRLSVPLVHIYLWAEWFLPALNLEAPLGAYREMSRRVVFLTRLQAPTTRIGYQSVASD